MSRNFCVTNKMKANKLKAFPTLVIQIYINLFANALIWDFIFIVHSYMSLILYICGSEKQMNHKNVWQKKY